MFQLRLMLLFAAILASHVIAQKSRKDTPPATLSDDPEIKMILDRVVQEQRVHGLAAAIVLPNGKIRLAVSGVRKQNANDPLELEDKLPLQQTSVVITHLLLSRIIQEEKVFKRDGLRTKVTTVFPDLKTKIDKGFRELTIGQLMTRNSGVPDIKSENDLNHFAIKARASPDPASTLVEDVLKVKPVNNSSGDHSRFATLLAVAMAEKATGQKFDALLQDRLITPLSLENTQLGNAGSRDTSPWVNVRGKPYYLEVPEYLYPCTGIFCSIEDLAKLAQIIAFGMRSEGAKSLKLTANSFSSMYNTNLTNNTGPFRIVEGPLGGRTKRYLEFGWSNLGAGTVIAISPDRPAAIVVMGTVDEVESGVPYLPLVKAQLARLLK